ncbi:60S RIBOSOMAL PROTEIN L19 [Encephalitozoon cuniculi GB-M1]|uniref:60S RIBOSOMAL PROTEIN L19 n=2 Tax=Encephalitozoon cuniculi TaxID=6035 RepID=Q8SRP5_ENCCU|nr:60S ribosomal protein L19 [Encephalitozoon cuniculi GB-M1]7QEP_M9 Chain M9, 60S RIBOSOMAL PROTEIN L19 [Encephalitozoon cuniculi GB-M1]AGE95748.1 60S ribosomal protein L19 [Encephalitozoon cuniculi]KMV66002.1 60S ribosomal protein L19 [Encephalitozoon cuniculi EcunIII-L]UYI27700.1 ribosomal protein L19 [Encephalitozoon cuniculi]CAD25468.1 60S RIBOSOMAL PROTEIN L19 [Encephalitozoon cuniculi GB-M1]
MSNEERVRRLASDILNCGKKKLWLDNNEIERLNGASTREQIKQLIKDNVIIMKQDKHTSRGRCRKRLEAKKKGRHMGTGKRFGTANARMPQKKIWMKKIRAMRAMLKEMRANGEITKEDFRVFYKQAKGHLFKHRFHMKDCIIKRKADEQRAKELAEQAKALNLSNRVISS